MRSNHNFSTFIAVAPLLILAVFSIITLIVTGISHAGQDEPDSEKIDNGDLLYVIIPQEVTSEFNPTTRNFFKEKVEVDRHGFIFLPTQGNIRVTGLSTEEISNLLTANLPKYLSKSDSATVNLIEKRHYVQILGHVTTPGWYNIPESANIQAILSQAGGSLEGADLAKVTITRVNNGKAKKIAANIQQYLLQGDPAVLPPLHENDTVFVPLNPTVEAISASSSTTDSPAIRIFGAVNNPGIYTSSKGMSLLDLLITAQGEAENADLTKVKIMRADGSRITFDMQALLDGQLSGEKASFPTINGGDIVHISRRPPQAVAAATEAAMPQTITIAGPGSNSRGLRPFTSPMTPLEAIVQSGGVNDFADTNDIVIIRRVDGKQQRLDYNYDKALLGKMPDVDFQLKAGDIIFIP